MKKAVEEVIRQIKQKEKELEALNKSLETFQSICKHQQTKWIGNNHNDNIYECVDCKKRFYE